ncbi:IS3 family transposase [Mammaliicoccus sciuri]|uniref:IS3 family transposase n=1 Tax=Mammaliicoccus sciuri TaxID=1296 RepID=UPI003365135B
MYKTRLPVKLYQEIFDLHEKGYSFQNVIDKLNLDISDSVIRFKYKVYKQHGITALINKNRNKIYTREFKEKVVKEYLETNKTYSDLAAYYNISHHATLKNWVVKYTEGKENKSYFPYLEVDTMNTRKTTFEERIEIAKYCIENNRDFNKTAEKYQVNYSQVYNWVKKYEKHGDIGLVDGRGKGKPVEALTREEELELKIKALEQRNKFLQMENEVLKKQEEIERQDESKIKQIAAYKTIEALKDKYPIKWICAALEISRASYYKWKNREVSESERFNNELKDEIFRIYHEHDGIYGYRRIYIYLRLYTKFQVNHKRVYRIMKKYGLKAVIRKKRRQYKLSKPEITSQNILNRKFTTSKVNKVWLTDVTEFKLKNGSKVYLSAIYDLGAKKVISHVVSSQNNNKLVYDTFNKAIIKRNTEGIIFHSDRGFQYTSVLFREMIKNASMKQSMSRVGRCIDNGPMEGFWGLLKSEVFKDKPQTFNDIKHATKQINEYIKFYNSKRISLKMAALIKAQPTY